MSENVSEYLGRGMHSLSWQASGYTVALTLPTLDIQRVWFMVYKPYVLKEIKT